LGVQLMPQIMELLNADALLISDELENAVHRVDVGAKHTKLLKHGIIHLHERVRAIRRFVSITTDELHNI